MKKKTEEAQTTKNQRWEMAPLQIQHVLKKVM